VDGILYVSSYIAIGELCTTLPPVVRGQSTLLTGRASLPRKIQVHTGGQRKLLAGAGSLCGVEPSAGEAGQGS